MTPRPLRPPPRPLRPPPPTRLCPPVRSGRLWEEALALMALNHPIRASNCVTALQTRLRTAPRSPANTCCAFPIARGATDGGQTAPQTSPRRSHATRRQRGHGASTSPRGGASPPSECAPHSVGAGVTVYALSPKQPAFVATRCDPPVGQRGTARAVSEGVFVVADGRGGRVSQSLHRDLVPARAEHHRARRVHHPHRGD